MRLLQIDRMPFGLDAEPPWITRKHIGKFEFPIGADVGEFNPKAVAGENEGAAGRSAELPIEVASEGTRCSNG